MGVSTDALLVYGYDLGGLEDAEGWKIREVDEDGEPAVSWYSVPEDAEECDFVEQAEIRLLVANGLTGDWRDDDYFERKREAQQRCGVTFERHCSDACVMYLLVAMDWTANRGYPVKVEPAHLTDPELIHHCTANLARALGVLGITPAQEKPGWILASFREE
jgi:hypothetical protein